MKPALLVIDMQKAYYVGSSVPPMNAACEYINAAAAFFRRKGLPVLWIQNKENSFTKTDLGTILAERGVDTIVVTGQAAEHCVLSTVRGANDLDLFSIALRGAIASADPQSVAFVEKISDVMSYGALAAALKDVKA